MSDGSFFEESPRRLIKIEQWRLDALEWVARAAANYLAALDDQSARNLSEAVTAWKQGPSAVMLAAPLESELVLARAEES